MESIDPRLFIRVLDLAGADVPIQLRVGEAQIVLIRLTAQTVNGHLLHQLIGQSQYVTDLLDLRHRQTGQRTEIPHRIAVASGITHPVLRQIAGVGHPSVDALGHGIHRGHPNTGRQIGDALGGQGKLLRHSPFEPLHRRLNIHRVVANA